LWVIFSTLGETRWRRSWQTASRIGTPNDVTDHFSRFGVVVKEERGGVVRESLSKNGKPRIVTQIHIATGGRRAQLAGRGVS
jgi:hypothetical protein